jgi:cytochrome P450
MEFSEQCLKTYREESKTGVKRDAPVLAAMLKQLEAGQLQEADISQLMLTVFLGGVETTANTAGTVLMELAVGFVVGGRERSAHCSRSP